MSYLKNVLITVYYTNLDNENVSIELTATNARDFKEPFDPNSTDKEKYLGKVLTHIRDPKYLLMNTHRDFAPLSTIIAVYEGFYSNPSIYEISNVGELYGAIHYDAKINVPFGESSSSTISEITVSLFFTKEGERR